MSAHDGDCVAPCQLNCPARTDCQGYVGLIANGEFDAALKLIKNKISLPASIGRVCPHPCESACRRKNVEEPINIAQLKAFAADVDLNSNKYIPEKKSAHTLDISGGGVKFLSNEDLEAGAFILTVIRLTNEKVDQTLYLVTEIVACERMENASDKKVVRAKFHFKDLKDRDLIVRFVFEEDRMLRKKENGD